jgi:hypothetical protein
MAMVLSNRGIMPPHALMFRNIYIPIPKWEKVPPLRFSRRPAMSQCGRFSSRYHRKCDRNASLVIDSDRRINFIAHRRRTKQPIAAR